MSEDPYRFLLRMPQALREGLRASADQNERSLNREIVARLEQGLLTEAGGRSRIRLGVLATAVALALPAGVAGFVAGEAGSGSPEGGERAVDRSQGRLGAQRFDWVRSGEFDPSARSTKS